MAGDRMTDRDWVTRAACRGEDPELFFPERGRDPRIETAFSICERCPVPDECAVYAQESGSEYGIWGGKLQGRDSRLKRPTRRRGYTRDLMPCGTSAAYMRHISHGEEPCMPCRSANAIASAERKRRWRERRAQ